MILHRRPPKPGASCSLSTRVQPDAGIQLSQSQAHQFFFFSSNAGSCTAVLRIHAPHYRAIKEPSREVASTAMI